MRIQLRKLAHARSGDKGDTANIGLIALRDEFYPLLVREVTADRVKQHLRESVKAKSNDSSCRISARLISSCMKAWVVVARYL